MDFMTLRETLAALGTFAGAIRDARDSGEASPDARAGAVRLLRSLQLARVALERAEEAPGGMVKLEEERAARYGDSHEK